MSYPGEGTHECTDCESRPARKPIAHKDALDEPVGHLCLFCYSEWMRKVPEDSACAICGDDSAYYSVREVTDLDQETILTTGNIGFCEMHAHECENLQTKIIAK